MNTEYIKRIREQRKKFSQAKRRLNEAAMVYEEAKKYFEEVEEELNGIESLSSYSNSEEKKQIPLYQIPLYSVDELVQMHYCGVELTVSQMIEATGLKIENIKRSFSSNDRAMFFPSLDPGTTIPVLKIAQFLSDELYHVPADKQKTITSDTLLDYDELTKSEYIGMQMDRYKSAYDYYLFKEKQPDIVPPREYLDESLSAMSDKEKVEYYSSVMRNIESFREFYYKVSALSLWSERVYFDPKTLPKRQTRTFDRMYEQMREYYTEVQDLILSIYRKSGYYSIEKYLFQKTNSDNYYKDKYYIDRKEALYNIEAFIKCLKENFFIYYDKKHVSDAELNFYLSKKVSCPFNEQCIPSDLEDIIFFYDNGIKIKDGKLKMKDTNIVIINNKNYVNAASIFNLYINYLDTYSELFKIPDSKKIKDYCKEYSMVLDCFDELIIFQSQMEKVDRKHYQKNRKPPMQMDDDVRDKLLSCLSHFRYFPLYEVKVILGILYYIKGIQENPFSEVYDELIRIGLSGMEWQASNDFFEKYFSLNKNGEIICSQSSETAHMIFSLEQMF